MSGRVRRRGEEGTILLFGIGLLLVCLFGLLVVVDAATAFLQRRSLVAVADAAALAGAQAIDIDAYYRDGAMQGTRLNPVLVVEAARRQITRLPDAAAIGIEAIQTDGVTVRVRLRRPLELPFLADAFGGDVRVDSAARLDYRPAP